MSPTSHRPPVGQVDFLGSFPGRLPAPDLPEIAFAGRSNVGKSSAINTLLGRKKVARVSKTPGRTQAINLFRIDGRFTLADLPGYGFAKVPLEVKDRWKGLVESYLGTRETLRLVVSLVDARHGPQNNDLMLLSGLRAADVPYVVVATKTDKLTRNKRKGTLTKLARGLGEPTVLGVSSLSGDGFDTVWARIEAALAEAP